MTVTASSDAGTITGVNRAVTASVDNQPGNGNGNNPANWGNVTFPSGQSTIGVNAVASNVPSSSHVGWIRVSDSLGGQTIVNTAPVVVITSATRSSNNTFAARTATIVGTTAGPVGPFTYALAIVDGNTNQVPASNSALWVNQGASLPAGGFTLANVALTAGQKSLFLRVTDAAGAQVVLRLTRTGGGGFGSSTF
jgi:hypothetical protein